MKLYLTKETRKVANELRAEVYSGIEKACIHCNEKNMKRLYDLLGKPLKAGDWVLSIGTTHSGTIMYELARIDEIQPGKFQFGQSKFEFKIRIVPYDFSTESMGRMAFTKYRNDYLRLTPQQVEKIKSTKRCLNGKNDMKGGL